MENSGKKIRVLVVDDSAFMRVAISKMMEKEPRIEVIGTARNGAEGIEKIKQLKPDLVMMDIEMPVMDGLKALEIVMKEMPLPVIMISSLTEQGADATFKALELGAVDYIPKAAKSSIDLDIHKIAEQLRLKVISLGSRPPVLYRAPVPKQFPAVNRTLNPVSRPQLSQQCHVVALGISTGGPLALQNMLPDIPADISAGILIVQHMPPTFTGPFARRLDGLCQIHVKEAEDHDLIEPGHAYVAHGGIHMKLKSERNGLALRIHQDPQPDDLLFVPSVDVMMLSLMENYKGNVLGVIMTGMGSDGLKGMTRIREKGGVTIAQDKESCVIYGMPKACVDNQIIDHILPLGEIAGQIAYYTNGTQTN